MTGIEAIAELFAGPGARDYLGEAVSIGERVELAERLGGGLFHLSLVHAQSFHLARNEHAVATVGRTLIRTIGWKKARPPRVREPADSRRGRCPGCSRTRVAIFIWH